MISSISFSKSPNFGMAVHRIYKGDKVATADVDFETARQAIEKKEGTAIIVRNERGKKTWVVTDTKDADLHRDDIRTAQQLEACTAQLADSRNTLPRETLRETQARHASTLRAFQAPYVVEG